MQINLRYIRNIVYSNDFFFLLLTVSGHAVYEEGHLGPSEHSE